MLTRAPGLLALRVMSGLHGLPLLAWFLWGAFLLMTDLLAEESVNEGLGLVFGALLMVITLGPLMVAVVAVVCRHQATVRLCGFVIGVASMTCAWVWTGDDLAHGFDLAPFLPGVLMCGLSIGSAIAAYGAPLEEERPEPTQPRPDE